MEYYAKLRNVSLITLWTMYLLFGIFSITRFTLGKMLSMFFIILSLLGLFVFNSKIRNKEFKKKVNILGFKRYDLSTWKLFSVFFTIVAFMSIFSEFNFNLGFLYNFKLIFIILYIILVIFGIIISILWGIESWKFQRFLSKNYKSLYESMKYMKITSHFYTINGPKLMGYVFNKDNINDPIVFKYKKKIRKLTILIITEVVFGGILFWIMYWAFGGN